MPGTERNAALGGRAELVLHAEPGADLEEAARLIERSLEPAPGSRIAQWLAALRTITAHRAGSAAEARLATGIYVERLRAWPADVVAYALLAHRWRWFPALGEIEEVCDELAAPRRVLRQALRTGRVRRAAELGSATSERVRPEAVRRILAEAYGRDPSEPAPGRAPGWQRAGEVAALAVGAGQTTEVRP